MKPDKGPMISPRTMSSSPITLEIEVPRSTDLLFLSNNTPPIKSPKPKRNITSKKFCEKSNVERSLISLVKHKHTCCQGGGPRGPEVARGGSLSSSTLKCDHGGAAVSKSLDFTRSR